MKEEYFTITVINVSHHIFTST